MIGGFTMGTDLRKLGQNIEKASQSIYSNIEDFANAINISVKDMYRVFEGRLLLPPSKLIEVSRVINKPLGELLETNEEYKFIECMGNFKEQKNEEKILDIIDNYIDLVEAIS